MTNQKASNQIDFSKTMIKRINNILISAQLDDMELVVTIKDFFKDGINRGNFISGADLINKLKTVENKNIIEFINKNKEILEITDEQIAGKNFLGSNYMFYMDRNDVKTDGQYSGYYFEQSILILLIQWLNKSKFRIYSNLLNFVLQKATLGEDIKIQELQQQLTIQKQQFDNAILNLHKDWLYVMSNDSLPGVVKQGFTQRSLQERATEIDTTEGYQNFSRWKPIKELCIRVVNGKHAEDSLKIKMKQFHIELEMYEFNIEAIKQAHQEILQEEVNYETPSKIEPIKTRSKSLKVQVRKENRMRAIYESYSSPQLKQLCEKMHLKHSQLNKKQIINILCPSCNPQSPAYYERFLRPYLLQLCKERNILTCYRDISDSGIAILLSLNLNTYEKQLKYALSKYSSKSDQEIKDQLKLLYKFPEDLQREGLLKIVEIDYFQGIVFKEKYQISDLSSGLNKQSFIDKLFNQPKENTIEWALKQDSKLLKQMAENKGYFCYNGKQMFTNEQFIQVLYYNTEPGTKQYYAKFPTQTLRIQIKDKSFKFTRNTTKEQIIDQILKEQQQE